MELSNFQIFKNKQKKEGSKQPDFRITAQINGKYEEVGACWWKQDNKGNYYQSCSVKKKDELTEEEKQKIQEARDREFNNFGKGEVDVEVTEEEINADSIPF